MAPGFRKAEVHLLSKDSERDINQSCSYDQSVLPVRADNNSLLFGKILSVLTSPLTLAVGTLVALSAHRSHHPPNCVCCLAWFITWMMMDDSITETNVKMRYK
jgi:hypothetical protein